MDTEATKDHLIITFYNKLSNRNPDSKWRDANSCAIFCAQMMVSQSHFKKDKDEWKQILKKLGGKY